MSCTFSLRITNVFSGLTLVDRETVIRLRFLPPAPHRPLRTLQARISPTGSILECSILEVVVVVVDGVVGGPVVLQNRFC